MQTSYQLKTKMSIKMNAIMNKLWTNTKTKVKNCVTD